MVCGRCCEHRRISRSLRRLPNEVLERYEKWKDIVSISGPEGLRTIRGFNDEALRGEWRAYRSSHLNIQYRVIYRIDRDRVFVSVEKSLLMTMGDHKMTEYVKAKKVLDVSVGDSVRIIRELQGLSQNELAKLTGIPQSAISAIENDRINSGIEGAKTLAKALKCHPAVLVFPGWEIGKNAA